MCSENTGLRNWTEGQSNTIPWNVYPDYSFQTAEPFVTSRCMVVHYHQPECPQFAKRTACATYDTLLFPSAWRGNDGRSCSCLLQWTERSEECSSGQNGVRTVAVWTERSEECSSGQNGVRSVAVWTERNG